MYNYSGLDLHLPLWLSIVRQTSLGTLTSDIIVTEQFLGIQNIYDCPLFRPPHGQTHIHTKPPDLLWIIRSEFRRWRLNSQSMKKKCQEKHAHTNLLHGLFMLRDLAKSDEPLVVGLFCSLCDKKSKRAVKIYARARRKRANHSRFVCTRGWQTDGPRSLPLWSVIKYHNKSSFTSG